MTIRIAIGGLKKEVTERVTKEIGGDKVSVIVTSDFEAAKKIKSGQADYYFGACNSGVELRSPFQSGFSAMAIVQPLPKRGEAKGGRYRKTRFRRQDCVWNGRRIHRICRPNAFAQFV
ncbi:hypothetical protein GCM10025859_32670 [Alicyclobacillus fastidiosus]|nr:hypothetical protein GCM10025859_32670 [Alicyclobacillus fastidiosus]